MRPELAEPIRDQPRLQKLLSLAERIFQLHEAGVDYKPELKQASRIAGRIVSVSMVLYAFGAEDAECFARRLLTDWNSLPRDLTEPEMLELLHAICSAAGTQEYDGRDLTPEEILQVALRHGRESDA